MIYYRYLNKVAFYRFRKVRGYIVKMNVFLAGNFPQFSGKPCFGNEVQISQGPNGFYG